MWKCELDNKGFGTEQIEEEVNALFPEFKVARMDLDTTRGKHGYERIITAFEQQRSRYFGWDANAYKRLGF